MDKEIAPENPAEFVTVTFDVSKNGRVHNARITEQSPNAISSARRRALESLRGNRFRPRLQNGVGRGHRGVGQALSHQLNRMPSCA